MFFSTLQEKNIQVLPFESGFIIAEAHVAYKYDQFTLFVVEMYT